MKIKLDVQSKPFYRYPVSYKQTAGNVNRHYYNSNHFDRTGANALRSYHLISFRGSEIGEPRLTIPIEPKKTPPKGWIGVKTKEDLKNALLENKKVILLSDIDFGEKDNNWTPIGTKKNPFKGELDGNGHVISNINLSWKGGDIDEGAFIRFANNAVIKNLILKDVNIKSYMITGSIAGKASNNTLINNCSVSGKIRSLERSAGGIVGANTESKIVNCNFNGKIRGVFDTGGIAGYNMAGSCIQNCSSKGEITGMYNTGGIAGFNTIKSNIVYSTSYALVKGENKYDEAGSIVGFNSADSEIKNCLDLSDCDEEKLPLIGFQEVRYTVHRKYKI